MQLLRHLSEVTSVHRTLLHAGGMTCVVWMASVLAWHAADKKCHRKALA